MLIFTKLVIYSLILTRNKDYKSFKNEWEHLLTRHALIIKYFLDMIWFLSKHFSWTLSLTLVLSYISYDHTLSSFMHVTIINLWYYNYQISLSFVIVRKLSDHCGMQLFQIFLWKAWSLSSGKTWGGKVLIHQLTSGKAFSVASFHVLRW
jgi:hypothetical protein